MPTLHEARRRWESEQVAEEVKLALAEAKRILAIRQLNLPRPVAAYCYLNGLSLDQAEALKRGDEDAPWPDEEEAAEADEAEADEGEGDEKEPGNQGGEE